MVAIRPQDLSPVTGGIVSPTAALITDEGYGVRRATPAQVVDAGAPINSQAEAEAGSVNAGRMTPLRTAQAIAALSVSQDVLSSSTGAGGVGWSHPGGPTRTILESMRTEYRFTDLGGVGNDSPADIAANNAAFALAISIVPEGGRLIFDQGIYRYDVNPRFDKNGIHFTGEGTLKPVGWIDGLQIADPSYPSMTFAIHDIEVSGLTFDGSEQSAGASDTFGNGLNLNGVDYINVHDCTFRNIKQQSLVSTFYQLASVLQKSVLIHSNLFQDSAALKIVVGIEGEGSGAIITGNSFVNIPGEAINFSNNGGGVVTNGRSLVANNNIVGSGSTGRGIRVGDIMHKIDIVGNHIRLFDTGISVGSDAGSVGDVLISSNRCLDWVTAGVQVFPMNGSEDTEALIIGNLISSANASGSSYGILVHKGATVTANKVRSGNTGIFCSGSGQRLLSNEIRGPATSIDTAAASATGVIAQGNVTDGVLSLHTDTIYEHTTGYGGDVASATSVTFPVNGDVFNITGTATIDGITATANRGRTLKLIFASTATVSEAGNVKLSAAFTASADDTLTLICNGTSWFETARSVN